MWLLCDDLENEVVQEFEVSSSNRVSLKAFSFWLYLNNPDPSTELTISLTDESDVVIYSEVLPIAGIRTQLEATDDYSHGKYVWETPTALRLGRGVYKLKLEQTDGFSPTSYIAWCKDWENPYIQQSDPILNDSMTAYFFRMYEYKDRFA